MALPSAAPAAAGGKWLSLRQLFCSTFSLLLVCGGSVATVADCQTCAGPSPGSTSELLGAERTGTATAPTLQQGWQLLPATQVCTAPSAAADRAWQEAGVPPLESKGASKSLVAAN